MNDTQVLHDFDIVGNYFKELIPKIKVIALTDLPVLITGETGTGKELAAKLIHHYSKRQKYPLTFVNIPSINSGLFESELFGHKKGAFTDASNGRDGAIKTTRNGTLVLDEIGNLSLDSQVKLLRWLESGEIKPVGEDISEIVDVRIIASTNQNLDVLIAEKKFRLDLYNRLTGLTIHLQPLREDKEEILDLTQYFVQKNAHLFTDVYGNPVSISGSEFNKLFNSLCISCTKNPKFLAGNARELENMVRQWLLDKALEENQHALPPTATEIQSVTYNSPNITPPIDVTTSIQDETNRYSFVGALVNEKMELTTEGLRIQSILHETIQKREMNLIRNTLRFYHGNKGRTSTALGIARIKLNELLTKYGIQNDTATSLDNFTPMKLSTIKNDEQKRCISYLASKNVTQKIIATILTISISTLNARLKEV